MIASISASPASTPPFSLKSLKPYRSYGCFGEADDGFRRQRLSLRSRNQVVRGVGLGPIVELRLLAVRRCRTGSPSISTLSALHAFAEQRLRLERS
jgi:hypothetical protein